MNNRFQFNLHDYWNANSSAEREKIVNAAFKYIAKVEKSNLKLLKKNRSKIQSFNSKPTRLINMLINYKSHNYPFYEDYEIVKQLKFILYRQKDWDGDVMHWFSSKYLFFSAQPSFDTKYHGSPLLLNSDLPF